MRLYLQFGWGMMGLCREMVETWDGGTVVLSPRDLNHDQLLSLSSEIVALPNGEVLLDPQFYVPHSNHERLCSHPFWPAEYDTDDFWTGIGPTRLIAELLQCNESLGCAEIILPGMMASEVNDHWLATQQAVQDAIIAASPDRPTVTTIALTADALRDGDQVAAILEHAEGWQSSGYYVVCEHPNGEYLVNDLAWLSNLLDLVAGLRLRRAKVILGYCSHQSLIAAIAKVDAICSGTWLNVRYFSADKFWEAEGIGRRAVWYYCPQALSEYKIPSLDQAYFAGILDSMATPSALNGGYADELFSGAQPSSVAWSESQAFRHYLFALHRQADRVSRDSFDETVDRQIRMLDRAERLLEQLESARISDEVRNYGPILNVHRDAIQSLISP